MKTEFLIKGRLCFEQKLFDIKDSQFVYNKLRDLGFYDLDVEEFKEPKENKS